MSQTQQISIILTIDQTDYDKFSKIVTFANENGIETNIGAYHGDDRLVPTDNDLYTEDTVQYMALNGMLNKTNITDDIKSRIYCIIDRNEYTIKNKYYEEEEEEKEELQNENDKLNQLLTEL